MIDKVQKIREEVVKLKSNLMYGACSSQIAMETTCKEEAYNEVLAILDTMQEEQEEPAIDELEKVVEEIVDPTVLNAYGVKEIANRLRKTMIEPVSEDLEEAANDAVISLVPSFGQKYSDGSYVSCIRDSFKREELIKLYKAGAEWQKAKDESTTEDLGEYINELSKQFPEVSFAKLSRITVRVAKWQKEYLWKPADGDDLPIIDKDVIALLDNGKVVFAHRPPEYWDGKDIVTGKVTRHYPKTYDKGGWNIPNVKYWLDVELPKEIEL